MKVRVSIDLDGTFYAYPKLVTEIANALQQAGNKVGILTGRIKEQEKSDKERLKKFGFIPDFFINQTDGIVKAHTKTLDWKAFILGKEKIDIHFDDEADAIRHRMPKEISMLILKMQPHEKQN